MKILLAGGGTGGPTAPLIAVANKIAELEPDSELLFLGTKEGPEQNMLAGSKIAFEKISAGKWRRYFSWHNFFTPLHIFKGFFQSFKILKRFRPDCVVGAGSFVQVPVVWAAWMLKIPVVLHQQDIQAGLANKICQFAADKITFCFEETALQFFSGFGSFKKKTQAEKFKLTGNPVRNFREISRSEALNFFKFHDRLPVLFVLGGGTGSLFLNNLVKESLPKLLQIFQIIHLTGLPERSMAEKSKQGYWTGQFLKEIELAYGAADLVICRAGISTLSELSFFKKPAVVIPMPNSHQELNAWHLEKTHSAVVIPQNILTPEIFVKVLRQFLFKPELQKKLKQNIGQIFPSEGAMSLAKIVIKLAKQ